MKYVLVILIAFLAVGAIYNYVPLKYFEIGGEQKLGTSITTIQGTDTLSNSRTTINNNFSALNNGKIENNSTTLSGVTSIPNLATVGTITSGTWTGTAISVAKGGTGSTTLSSNQVLLGNGASGFKTVSGWGTSGQFLTSGGSGAAPTWQSSSVDQTANYTWTGRHSFGASTSTPWKLSSVTIEQNGAVSPFLIGDTGTSTPLAYLSPKGAWVLGSTTPTGGTTQAPGNRFKLIVNGTSTANNLLLSSLAGLDSFSFNKVLAINSTGAISSQGISSLNAFEVVAASSTQHTTGNTTNETTLGGFTIPANSLGPNGVIRVRAGGNLTSSGNAKTLKIYLGGRGGTLLTSMGATSVDVWAFDVTIANRNATNSQITHPYRTGTTATTLTLDALTTAARDTTSSQDVTITVTKATGTETATLEYLTIEVVKKP